MGRGCAGAVVLLSALGSAGALAGEKTLAGIAAEEHIKGLYAAKYAAQKAAFLRLVALGKEVGAPLAEEKEKLEDKLVELSKEMAALKEAKGPKKKDSRGPKAIKRELKDVRVAAGWVDVLLAEIEATRDWSEKLPPDLQGKLDSSVSLAFGDEPLGRALASVGRQVGAEVALSPAADKVQKVSVVEVTGRPTLRKFLDWVCQQFELRTGAAGGKIVMRPKVE